MDSDAVAVRVLHSEFTGAVSGYKMDRLVDAEKLWSHLSAAVHRRRMNNFYACLYSGDR